MAKKIDLSGVKEFIFNHGEKVALGTCAFIAILFGTLGFWRALGASKADGSGKPLTQELVEHIDRISGGIRDSQAPDLSSETKERMNPDNSKWAHLPSYHVQNPLIVTGSEKPEKRVNPIIYSVKKERKHFDMLPVTACFLAYKSDHIGVKILVDAQGGGGGVGGAGGGGKPPGGFGGGGQMGGGMAGNKGGGTPFMHEARPFHAVIGTAVFPMKQQVLEFQRALKMQYQSEMLAPDKRDDAPRPIGIDVIRFEIKPNGEKLNPAGDVVVGIDPKTGKFVKSAALEALLHKAVFDEAMPVVLEPYLFHGLHLPMPKFAFGRYPQFKIEDFDIAWGDEEPEQKGGDLAGKGPAKGGDKGGVGFPGLKGGGGKGGKGLAGGEEDVGTAGPAKNVDVIKKKDLLKDQTALHNRLYKTPADPNHYNIYHVLGLFKGDQQPAANKGGAEVGFGKQNNNNAVDRYFHPWDIAPAAAGEGGDDEPSKKKGGPGLGKPPNAGLGGGGGGAIPGVGGGPDIGLGGGKEKQPGNPGGGLGGLANNGNWERDAIVRFIDPDVETGKTYRYAIRVRMHNPNFNKGNAVAFLNLAEQEVLMSDWEETPDVYVPSDYNLYALDQQTHDHWTAPPVIGKPATPAPLDPKWRDHVTFQIHQWVKRKFDPVDRQDFVIGDWAVAERVSVRRGERIGVDVPVIVPVWKELKDAFEIPHQIKDTAAKDPKKAPMKPGIKIDMAREVKDGEFEAPPVLVDYTGGKRGVAKFEEESALEALVLSADGTLSVLNSRVDADPAMTPPRHGRIASPASAAVLPR